MYTADQLYNKLMDCPWLKRCGIPEARLFSFSTIWIQDVDEITKAITSMEWENICLEEHGNISEFLAVNYKAEYCHSWNTTVAFLKSKHLPDIMFRIENAYQPNKLPSSILNDIRFNLLSIFLANHYQQYYQSSFFSMLLSIYISGHLPCGWQGVYPDGSIMIF